MAILTSNRVNVASATLLIVAGISATCYAYLHKSSPDPKGYQMELVENECTHKSGVIRDDWLELTMVSGSESGTYYPFAHDICVVAKDMDIKIDAVVGHGSLSNMDTVYAGDAQLGMVQLDILSLINDCIEKIENERDISAPCKDVYAKYRESVDYLASMYLEEVHVIVKRDSGLTYQDIRKDKEKIIYASGGSYITALNLFDGEKRIKQNMRDVPHHLSQGTIHAIVRVVGKSKAIGDEYGKQMADIEFVTVPFVTVKDEYGTSTYEEAILEYGWMEEPIRTIGVRSILIANNRDARNKTAICTLSKILHSPFYLSALNEYGHPKWRNVMALQEIPDDWGRFDCSTQ